SRRSTRFRSTTIRWSWSACGTRRFGSASDRRDTPLGAARRLAAGRSDERARAQARRQLHDLRAHALMITLTLKEQPSVPLEAENVSPDVMATLPHADIRALPVYLGKRQRRLDDFFAVEGEVSEEIEIRGDATRVKWIGRAMTRGRIAIAGNAGMHLGAYMKGGTIEVSGNASDWVGAEMSGGLIRIRGNAGGQVGAAYRGSLSG